MAPFQGLPVPVADEVYRLEFPSDCVILFVWFYPDVDGHICRALYGVFCSDRTRTLVHTCCIIPAYLCFGDTISFLCADVRYPGEP